MDALTTAEKEINELLKDFNYKPGFLVRVIPRSQWELTIKFALPIWTPSGAPLGYGGYCRIDWGVIDARMKSGETRKEFVFEALRRAILKAEMDIAHKFFAGESPVLEPGEWVSASLQH